MRCHCLFWVQSNERLLLGSLNMHLPLSAEGVASVYPLYSVFIYILHISHVSVLSRDQTVKE